MASFAVLADEDKILRRKEKEAERQQKIQDKLKEVASKPSVGNWADASDDEEDEKLFKPVSDSESEKSEDWDAAAEDKAAAGADDRKPEAKAPAGKGKKDKKKGKADADKPPDEDLDGLLAEFGVEVTEVETSTK